MQRIDENTYLDDTLVTCAEYQLFIDEMREQGKYYQPDHWTSYQFPQDQAREPILGVRHADAVAFCEWLTQQNDVVWKFSLPSPKEANGFPIKVLGNAPLGYWLKDAYQFAWIKPVNQDACEFNIARDRILSRILNQNLGFELCIDVDFEFDFDLVLSHDLARNLIRKRKIDPNSTSKPDLDRTRKLDLVRARDIARVLTRARDHEIGLDLAHAHANARNLDLDLVLGRDIGRGRQRCVRSHALGRIRALDRALDHARGRALGFALALDPNNAHTSIRTFTLKPAIERARLLALDRDRVPAIDVALDIYVELSTIRERIAGRYPAFEGIRLVKERRR